MITYDGKTYLTTKEACQVMDKSIEALRQLIHRNRLNTRKIGARLYLDNAEVMDFFPLKYKLPPFETLDEELKNEEFFSFSHVQGIFQYTSAYLKNLIKNGKMIGYATSDGQILIPKSSLDKYMGVSDEGQDTSESDDI